jgi:hypothetical protein
MEMAVAMLENNEPHAAAKTLSVTEEDWGSVMDAREAFCIAVKYYRSGDWNPALPTSDKVVVRGQPLTLRQVCGLVAQLLEPLPNSVVGDLVTSLRVRHNLIGEEFAGDRTFAAGARCLLRLMDERECAFRRNVERDPA